MKSWARVGAQRSGGTQAERFSNTAWKRREGGTLSQRQRASTHLVPRRDPRHLPVRLSACDAVQIALLEPQVRQRRERLLSARGGPQNADWDLALALVVVVVVQLVVVVVNFNVHFHLHVDVDLSSPLLLQHHLLPPRRRSRRVQVPPRGGRPVDVCGLDRLGDLEGD